MKTPPPSATPPSAPAHDAPLLDAPPLETMVGEPELRKAAMDYLARFSASQAGLLRVLDRRIERRARQRLAAGGLRDEVREQQRQASAQARSVVAEMARIGAVDDAAFAQGRALALTRSGRSARSVAADLAGRGVEAAQIEAALGRVKQDGFEEAPLAAALLQARKRRIGPFAAGDANAGEGPGRSRALAALARAGFSNDVALAALEIDLETAESLIARLRGGS